MTTSSEKPYTGPWHDKRNKRRKADYASDPAYRASQQEMSRASYRKTNKVDLFDPRTNLSIIHTFGMDIGGVLKFNVTHLAKALQRSPKQVRQWIADERLPAPDAAGYYTRPEVDAIIQALGPTLSQFAYFRTDHVEAIAAVHEAVRALRG